MENKIPFSETGLLSNLIRDYLSEKEDLKNFYGLFPNENNLIKQAKKKLTQFKNREILVEEINNQYQNFNLSKKQEIHFKFLSKSNTVTVTTGHQLNLLTGPLYSIYKILQTIKLADSMNQFQNEIHFVPIFWMASEDHDFVEINHYWVGNQKVQWNSKQTGAVGRFKTSGLDKILSSWLEKINKQEKIYDLINAYRKHKTLSEAHKYIVNELFKDYGLLIIDADSKNLKQCVKDYFKDDLNKNTAYKRLSETNQILKSKNYKIQVNPREINLFYLKDDLRSRIEKENNIFKVIDSNIQFSQLELEKELENHPERFSPNVILRPLYQEIILPNVAYVGGNGEIQYWLQLKSYFDSQNVEFPILIPRNSILIKTEKQEQKQKRLKIKNKELFLPLESLIKTKILSESEPIVDFSEYEFRLDQMFKELQEKSKKTHISFENMIKAQHKKQLNGLEKMKKRMILAEVKANSDIKNRIELIHSEFFPNGSLQERNQNFTVFWLEYGAQFLEKIYNEIIPIQPHFNHVVLPD